MNSYKVIFTTPLGIKEYDGASLGSLTDEGELADGFLLDYKRKVGGKITFNEQDFKDLETIDNSTIRYNPIYLKIFDTSNNNTVIDGRLSLYEGNYDKNACTAQFKVTLNDKYSEFDKEAETIHNAFDITTSRVPVTNSQIVGLIKNGVLLSELLPRLYDLANTVNGQVFSNTLAINTSNNGLYAFTTLHQKSDVIRRDIVGYVPATKMAISLKQLLEAICTKLNLFYKIDDYGNLLIDDYNTIKGTASDYDLTTQKPDEIFFTENWEYKNEKVYKREVYVDNSVNEKLGTVTDFTGVPIEYDNAIVNALEKEAEVIKTCEFFTNVKELSLIDPLNEDVDYEGIVWIACSQGSNGNHNIIQAAPILSSTSEPNNILSWAYVHDNFFKTTGRLFQNGTINGNQTTFTNLVRTKLQKKVVIKKCSFDNIDIHGKVKSNLGWGIIDKFKHDLISNRLELDLLFEPDESNVIYTPTANDDNYNIPMGGVLNTAASFLPTLLANDVGGVSAYAETKQTAFGGTVQIFANGHIIYTPPSASYYGLDWFLYTAIDLNSHTSTARVNIGVRYPTIYVRRVLRWIPRGANIRPYHKYEAYWYKDSAGTQPLNVTGYGMQLNFRTSLSSINPVTFGAQQSMPATSYSQEFYNTAIINHSALTSVWLGLITSSADYTIIP